MTLHRRIPVGLTMPEADPSVTQAAPVFGAGDLVETVKIPGPGTVVWWGVGKDGNTNNAVSVAGTGASFDARLVIRIGADKGVGSEYLGFTSISQTLGADLPVGRVAIDRDLPDGAEGWIILSALTIGTSPASHIAISYRWIRGAAIGV